MKNEIKPVKLKPGWIRITFFDPGITYLGWCVTDYDPVSGKRLIIKTGVLKAGYLARKRKDEVIKYEARIIAFTIIEDFIRKLLLIYKPDHIGSEGAFINRFRLNAFPALIGVIHTIQTICYKEFKLKVYKYAPKYIKATFTGNGNASKEDIKKGVLDHPDIDFKQPSMADKLSSHEYDSIAGSDTFIVTDYVTLKIN
ncbi:MAG: crossover junction endodeoxyribonuclease RuvC [Alphaproteobacteria bacterium]|nr:crossover junction endodeoxyribonuclease RuvC [Alphaproteobacteria bacterium]